MLDKIDCCSKGAISFDASDRLVVVKSRRCALDVTADVLDINIDLRATGIRSGCQKCCPHSRSDEPKFSLSPYHPSVFHASHRGGKGRQAWRILTMRRMPRVNQDVLPRATFAG